MFMLESSIVEAQKSDANPNKDIINNLNDQIIRLNNELNDKNDK